MRRKLETRTGMDRKNVGKRMGAGTARAAGILAAAAMTAMAVLGCGSGPALKGNQGAEDFKLSDSTKDLTGQYQKPRNYGEVAITDEFCQSYGDFALELLRASRQEAGENPMVSPLSVMAALEMTRSGAQGETQAQMDKTLYGELQPQEAGRELMAYLQGLPSQEKARFHFANSIWFTSARPDFQVDEDFLKNSAEAYGANIFSAPFDETTLQDINGWVAHETEGMIPDILDKIDQDAVMYLVNGVSFDAQWQEIYTENQVHEGEFFPAQGEPQAVKMMYSEEGYLIGNEKGKGFLKPYAEGYAFAALLPEEGLDVDAYLEELTGEELAKMLDQPSQTPVEAGLPVFSAGTKLTMNEMLKAMGMPLAFDQAQADFGGMGACPDGINLCIGRALHSTLIQVDEQGTKAGAATAVEMIAEGAAEVQPERVILDRPFLYAIIDMENHLPIFLGIMETAEEK